MLRRIEISTRAHVESKARRLKNTLSAASQCAPSTHDIARYCPHRASQMLARELEDTYSIFNAQMLKLKLCLTSRGSTLWLACAARPQPSACGVSFRMNSNKHVRHFLPIPLRKIIERTRVVSRQQLRSNFHHIMQSRSGTYFTCVPPDVLKDGESTSEGTGTMISTCTSKKELLQAHHRKPFFDSNLKCTPNTPIEAPPCLDLRSFGTRIVGTGYMRLRLYRFEALAKSGRSKAVQ